MLIPRYTVPASTRCLLGKVARARAVLHAMQPQSEGKPRRYVFFPRLGIQNPLPLPSHSGQHTYTYVCLLGGGASLSVSVSRHRQLEKGIDSQKRALFLSLSPPPVSSRPRHSSLSITKFPRRLSATVPIQAGPGLCDVEHLSGYMYSVRPQRGGRGPGRQAGRGLWCVRSSLVGEETARRRRWAHRLESHGVCLSVCLSLLVARRLFGLGLILILG